LATLIPLVLKASIVLLVVGLGLRATIDDATFLFRRPSLLLRSLVSMNVIMPLFATPLALAFDFHQAVKIALVALAISPVPPILPKKELKAGGTASYSIGLLVAVALLAIILVPLATQVLALAFGREARISPRSVASLVLSTVLLPTAAGIALRRLAPAFAERMARPVSAVAFVLLIAGSLPILFTAWPAIWSLIGNGHVLAFVAFVLVGLTTGHLLGGPDPQDRTVLALSTASRHPGVAIAIAQANFPQQKLAMAAVLLYLLISVIVTLPYLKWARRGEGQHDTRSRAASARA
jgi:BASS family bile acid:Na+ symporter